MFNEQHFPFSASKTREAVSGITNALKILASLVEKVSRITSCSARKIVTKALVRAQRESQNMKEASKMIRSSEERPRSFSGGYSDTRFYFTRFKFSKRSTKVL